MVAAVFEAIDEFSDDRWKPTTARILTGGPFPRLREKAVQEHRYSQYFRDSLIITHVVYVPSNGRPKYAFESRQGVLALLSRDL
jgi:hypothetical protein